MLSHKFFQDKYLNVSMAVDWFSEVLIELVAVYIVSMSLPMYSIVL